MVISDLVDVVFITGLTLNFSIGFIAGLWLV